MTTEKDHMSVVICGHVDSGAPQILSPTGCLPAPLGRAWDGVSAPW